MHDNQENIIKGVKERLDGIGVEFVTVSIQLIDAYPKLNSNKQVIDKNKIYGSFVRRLGSNYRVDDYDHINQTVRVSKKLI